ncbi:CAP domain-containing protein [Bacteriovoracaceae bacterium]|nr:CAP domain-containing protein [Bacteriovoracaceae bacterium]
MKKLLATVLLFTFINITYAGPTDCGDMNQLACEMFLKVNEFRKSKGLKEMNYGQKCKESAQSHAEDMVERGFFSHHSPDETYKQRIRREGFTGAVAENIAIATTVDRTFNNWIKSPGHRRNILRAKYKYSGVGYIKRHWVQCFSSNND